MLRPQRKTRKSLKSNCLSFSQLEDRKLLAANLASGLQVPNDLPANTNLISNGEFETFEQGTAPSVTNAFATARFLPGQQVTGWNVLDGDGDGNSLINLRSFDNDRGSVLDLDSVPNQDDRVFQDIETQAGQQYLLAFDFRGSTLIDGNTDNSTNDFEVYFNGELIASLTGGVLWQTAAYTVTGAADSETGDANLSRLEFRDLRDGDRGGDGRGTLIDCVRLTAVSTSSIINGSFEDVGDGTGPNFDPDDVAGWSVLNFADDASPRVIQVNEFLSDEIPIDGSNYLSLNSDSDLIDNVFQDIATTEDTTYYVTFDYRTDPDSSADPEQLRVRWNNSWAATFEGTSEWQSVGILLDADSDLTRLAFREAGDSPGVGAGNQIDNVQIFAIDPSDSTIQNTAPTFAAIADQAVDFGETLELQTVADDADGDAVTYSISVADLNAGESQPSVSEIGDFSWIPTEAGEFDVTITATDTANAIAEQTFTVTVGSLTDIDPADRNGIYPTAPGTMIDTDNTYDAVFDTDVGTIEIRLLAEESPAFVNNFVSLAQDGFYDGLVFHRVIDGFVAQGGDPLGTGTGGPGYQIDDEVDNTIPFDSRGQLSFANSGNDTTGSQFFITLDATNLDTSQFSVFGNVTAGDDVLDEIVRTQVGNTTPIPGTVPTVINSISIIETPGDVT